MQQQRSSILAPVMAFVLAFAGVLANAQTLNETHMPVSQLPQGLEGVGIEEHLGAQLNLNLEFKNEKGETVKLLDIFNGPKPVLMTLVYFGCPGLCNYHLSGLIDVFKELKKDWVAGQEFKFVVISFDPQEDSVLAEEKKASHLELYGNLAGQGDWHFLTGSAENIKAVSEQFGFKYRWNEEAQEWAHAAAAYVMTPSGVISRYLYGIAFEAETLRLSLIEATNNKIGSIIDKITLFCFQFDPTKSKYTLYAFNLMRLGAGIVVLILASVLVPFWLRQRREQAARGVN